MAAGGALPGRQEEEWSDGLPVHARLPGEAGQPQERRCDVHLGSRRIQDGARRDPRTSPCLWIDTVKSFRGVWPSVGLNNLGLRGKGW